MMVGCKYIYLTIRDTDLRFKMEGLPMLKVLGLARNAERIESDEYEKDDS